jgi:hypothetical protein
MNGLSDHRRIVVVIDACRSHGDRFDAAFSIAVAVALTASATLFTGGPASGERGWSSCGCEMVAFGLRIRSGRGGCHASGGGRSRSSSSFGAEKGKQGSLFGLGRHCVRS